MSLFQSRNQWEVNLSFRKIVLIEWIFLEKIKLFISEKKNIKLPKRIRSIMVFVDIKNNLKAFLRFGKNEKFLNNFDGFSLKFIFTKVYKFNFYCKIYSRKKKI